MNKSNFQSTPLIDSVLHKDFDAFQVLISEGVDVNETDYNNLTALYYACRDGLVAMAKILIENGATIDVRDPHGNTPLMKAVYYSEHYGVELVSLLIENGADIDAKNNYGISPRMLALDSSNNESVLKAMGIKESRK